MNTILNPCNIFGGKIHNGKGFKIGSQESISKVFSKSILIKTIKLLPSEVYILRIISIVSIIYTMLRNKSRLFSINKKVEKRL